MNIKEEALTLHKKFKGKIGIKSKTRLDKKNLKLFYTPGVSYPCIEISKNKELSYEYTNKANTIAIISDGTSILGLGNIGPEAGMPVMEGKSFLYKELADIDAYPLCIDASPKEIPKIVKALTPSFAGIHFEDLSAPHCFEVIDSLKNLKIPVFNDDIHGTGIIVLAALKNALKFVKKDIEEIKVVILGAGAAGLGIANLLIASKVKDIIITDSKGILNKDRKDLNKYKERFARLTNKNNLAGSMETAIKDSDIIICVSGRKNLLNHDHIKMMKPEPIIFALSNPDPEILPEIAYKAGASIVATGSSLYPNQVNNVYAYPGFFRGVLDSKAKKINTALYLAAADAISSLVKNPSRDNIIPGLSKKNVERIAEVVKDTIISFRLNK